MSGMLWCKVLECATVSLVTAWLLLVPECLFLGGCVVVVEDLIAG